jgi:hypothetical protein
MEKKVKPEYVPEEDFDEDDEPEPDGDEGCINPDDD